MHHSATERCGAPLDDAWKAPLACSTQERRPRVRGTSLLLRSAAEKANIGPPLIAILSTANPLPLPIVICVHGRRTRREERDHTRDRPYTRTYGCRRTRDQTPDGCIGAGGGTQTRAGGRRARAEDACAARVPERLVKLARARGAYLPEKARGTPRAPSRKGSVSGMVHSDAISVMRLIPLELPC